MDQSLIYLTFLLLLILASLLVSSTEHEIENRRKREIPAKYFSYKTENVTTGGGVSIPQTTLFYYNSIAPSFKMTIYGYLPQSEDKMLRWMEEKSTSYEVEEIDYLQPTHNSTPTDQNQALKPKERKIWQQILPTECGYSGNTLKNKLWRLASTSRVVNGRPTTIENNPWQAAIVDVNEEGMPTVTCGGSIITTRHVLTAHHCFLLERSTIFKDVAMITEQLLGIKDRMVFVGSAKAEDSTFRYAIAKLYHSWFTTKHKRNDIALLMIEGTFTWNTNIYPICLPGKNTPYIPDAKCIISGWGNLEYKTTNYNRTLREAEVKISSNNACKEKNEAYFNFNITEGMFCAANELADKKIVDTCQGDSGGPLSCSVEEKSTLFGITSFGKGCAEEGYPGVYTKVSKYLPWIYERLENSINNEARANLHLFDIGKPKLGH